MKKLAACNIVYNDVFNTCVSNVNEPRNSCLKRAKPVLENNNGEYETKALANELYQINRHSSVTTEVSTKDMVFLYDKKFLKEGRDYYDLIITSAPHDTCPFCSQRKVKSLDHYLPKTLYPSYSISPLNLVPCCSDCNKEKGTRDPNTPNEQFIHPYFDDLNDIQWLRADVIEATPISFTYSVIDLSSYDTILFERVSNQFKTLGLGSLYASHAAEEFENIRKMLIELQECPDSSLKDQYLQMQCNASASVNINSWKTAMYNALVSSRWFQNINLNY